MKLLVTTIPIYSCEFCPYCIDSDPVGSLLCTLLNEIIIEEWDDDKFIFPKYCPLKDAYDE